MRQQVNLYLPEFRPRREWCTAGQVAAVWAVVLLAAAALFWLRQQELADLRERQAALEARRQALQTRVEEAQRKYPPRRKSPQLERRLGQLAQELHRRRRVLEMLEGGGLGSTGGFSPHLTALARQIVEGTWITSLELKEGGRGLRVRGSAIRPQLVPLYIERLGREPVFRGTLLEQVALERPEQDPLRIDFEFYTPGGGVDRG